jgi:hypothetical protein
MEFPFVNVRLVRLGTAKNDLMNWIQFYNEPKFEVVQPHKYIGPLSKREMGNMWSNFQYYSIKIKLF